MANTNQPVSWNDYPADFKEEVWEQDMPAIDKNKFLQVDLIIRNPEDNKDLVFRFASGCEIVRFEPLGEFCGGSLCVGSDMVWRPYRTDLRVFERVYPHTSKEVFVPRSAGIGVLILEPTQTYVKFIRDAKAKHGVKAICTVWSHRNDAKEVLDSDLSNGYEICYVAGETLDRKFVLHKKHTQRNQTDARAIPPTKKNSSSRSASPKAKATARARCSTSPKAAADARRSRSRSASPKAKVAASTRRSHSRSRSRSVTPNAGKREAKETSNTQTSSNKEENMALKEKAKPTHCWNCQLPLKSGDSVRYSASGQSALCFKCDAMHRAIVGH